MLDGVTRWGASAGAWALRGAAAGAAVGLVQAAFMFGYVDVADQQPAVDEVSRAFDDVSVVPLLALAGGLVLFSILAVGGAMFWLRVVAPVLVAPAVLAAEAFVGIEVGPVLPQGSTSDLLLLIPLMAVLCGAAGAALSTQTRCRRAAQR